MGHLRTMLLLPLVSISFEVAGTVDSLATGNLCVTVRNVSGASVSGARVVRYPNGTSVNTPNCFNSIADGAYSLEAYYTGTYWGEEYWGDGSANVIPGTTYDTINRIYPYIESVVFKIHSSGTVLSSTDSVFPGTTIRAEILVRNKVSVALNVRVRMRLDRSQSGPYDFDTSSANLSVSSNNTRTFTLTYTPSQTGAWYRSFEAVTTLLNGNTPRTDSWGWAQCFKVRMLTGSLKVNITPAGANDAGAQWRVDAGTWRDSGYTQSELSAGPHTVEFKTICGWNKPTDHQVQINSGATTTDAGNYTQTTGNLCVTVKNADGSDVTGARLVRYDPCGGTTSGTSPICWNGTPAGSYDCEAYYTGTFWGEEYWGDASANVSSGTVNLPINRIYPYIEGVTFKIHSTGAVLNPSDQIPPGTTVRTEILVRNKVSVALDVRIRMLLDRGQSGPYDFDTSSATLSVSSNSTRLFTLLYTPQGTGTWHRAFDAVTTLLNGNATRTDAWPWGQAFVVQVQTGDLRVTALNIGNLAVENARIVRYDPDGGSAQGYTGPDGSILWSDLLTGSYSCEAYYTGTFWGEEYWGDASALVTEGEISELPVSRIYPYIESIILKDNNTGIPIAPQDELESGKTVRAEVVVRNKVSQDLDVQIHLLADRHQSEPYDVNLTSNWATVASNSTFQFVLLFTPSQSGAWFRTAAATTALLNGNDSQTDSWPWEAAFAVVPTLQLDLLSISFDSDRYFHDDDVYATVAIRNNGSSPAEGVRFRLDLEDPAGVLQTGYSSPAFDIPPESEIYPPAFQVWHVPSGAVSGAYVPRFATESPGSTSSVTTTKSTSSMMPILAIGSFPCLNNLILKSQQHFQQASSASVADRLGEFAEVGLKSLSMSVKLDDGPGVWVTPPPIAGQVLFSSTAATSAAQSPLSYDLYSTAQSACASLGITLNVWFPTFYDHAQSQFDNPQWSLQNDPQNQGFIDGFLPAVRQYEAALINDAMNSPYSPPSRVSLDHFRFTHGQHLDQGGADSIAQFVQDVAASLPAATELAGYIWTPQDSSWSGQYYSLLEPHLDVLSPMLYWQFRQIGSNSDVPSAARSYIISQLSSIRSRLGQSTLVAKVQPTISITSAIDFSDAGSSLLDWAEWKRAQLNVLGAMGDEGCTGYDLFYAGMWQWDAEFGDVWRDRWMDWAASFARLGGCQTLPCACNCHGDPKCDDLFDIFDVVYTINVAFRNWPQIGDPNALCPSQDTDVDCNGSTDILDVVHIIEVCFRNGNPTVHFCQPCAQ